MSLLIGALTIGLILSLLALGVFISFRIFAFPDITADGSSALGAALAAALLVKGVHPGIATAAAFGGGFLAGAVTGALATKFKINGLLAGILVMTALYSVNLHIMGRSNVPLLGQRTASNYAERLGASVLGGAAARERPRDRVEVAGGHRTGEGHHHRLAPLLTRRRLRNPAEALRSVRAP